MEIRMTGGFERLAPRQPEIYLELKDYRSAKFYAYHYQPLADGTWALVTRRGKIGAQGTSMCEWFDTFAKLCDRVKRLHFSKLAKGYVEVGIPSAVQLELEM